MLDPIRNLLTRRCFLGESSLGLGGMALASLLRDGGRSDPPPHFVPRARRVIYLHLSGAPPTLDLFDHKPELQRRHGEPCTESMLGGRRFAFTSGVPTLLGTPRKFARHGENGMWVSDALPRLAKLTDKLTFVRSMWTDQFNHTPAELLLFTGSPRQGRPSMGSWVTYGLGAENRDLPGFVVLISGGTSPSAGQGAWGSGFLPSVHQGVACRAKGDPVLYVSDPAGLDRDLRRLSLDALAELNAMQAEAHADPETATRIAQYELAFRMQTSVPEVMDLRREPASMLALYGAEPGVSSFANHCLLARRLVEQGVRFVQLFDWGWDFHGTAPNEGLEGGLTVKCRGMDQAVSALITDLEQRGLLDDTLVVWGGEFGRTPFREGRTAKSAILGRDHYPDCFTVFLAGGGTRPGVIHGETDPLGFTITDKPVHVHDLQATILHLLGLDHERLTHRHQGRDFRLTDVHGRVVGELLA